MSEPVALYAHAREMSEYLARFASRSSAIIAKLWEISNPQLKEQRQFRVSPIVSLYDFVGSLMTDLHMSTPSGAWLPVGVLRALTDESALSPAHMPPGEVDSFIIDPFKIFIRSRGAHRDVPIQADLSRRTFVNGVDLLSCSTRLIRSLSVRRLTAVTLREFTLLADPRLHELAYHPFDDTPIAEVPFFVAIADLIRILAVSTLDQSREAFAQFQQTFYRPPSSSLVLKVKLYPNRGDVRAYYPDKHLPRHLSGAILNAILKFSQKRRDHASPSNRWYPPRGANILDIHIGVDTTDSVRVILGDISSFSCNNVNSWIWLYAVLLRLSMLDIGREVFGVRVGDTVVETSVCEAIRVYLAAVVGAPSFGDGREFTALGGYLGVKGNMSLCIYAFTLFFEEMSYELLARYQVDIQRRGQIGGDDFIVILVGKDLDSVDRATTFFLSEMRRTMGQLKEPTVSDVILRDGFKLDNLEFCKKEVDISVHYSVGFSSRPIWIDFSSVFNLPLIGSLFEPVASYSRTRADYVKFVSNVQDATKHLPCRVAIVQIYAAYYAAQRNITAPVTVEQRIYDYVELPFRYENTRWTESVNALLARFATVTLSDGSQLFAAPNSRILLLDDERVIRTTELSLDHVSHTVLTTSRDSNRRHRLSSSCVRVLPLPVVGHSAFLQHFADIVNSFRSNLEIIVGLDSSITVDYQ